MLKVSIVGTALCKCVAYSARTIAPDIKNDNCRRSIVPKRSAERAIGHLHYDIILLGSWSK